MLKKFKDIDKNYIIILVFCLSLILCIYFSGYLFGSVVDWFPQHIMFPDYFRKHFYETGDLFPDFAFAIGGGQNIYNFSYYGLYNPIFLISYLFPFMSMTNYIMLSMSIVYIISGFLFYKWMKRHVSSYISLMTTFIFLCASPLFFHLHRHFMFVNYMPFLIWGFMNVENYFKKGEKIYLTLSVFLLILTSYYYSIPCIVSLILYGIYCYVNMIGKMPFKKFIKDMFLFLVPIIISIIMASILLLPTMYTLLTGRSDHRKISILGLFQPKPNFQVFLYSPYSTGLTAISILAILYGIIGKCREKRFLSISILILFFVPVFSYLLNGTLYIRDKVFIPFLPLIAFFLKDFFSDIYIKSISKKVLYLYIIICIWIFIMGYRNILFYVDIFLNMMIIFYLVRSKKQSKSHLLLFLFIPFCTFVVTNFTEKYVKFDTYTRSSYNKQEIEEVLEEEDEIFRFANLKESLYNVNKIYTENYYIDSLYSSVYHYDYREFYNKIFKNPLSYRNKLITSSNGNLLYQLFMANKYIYSDFPRFGYIKKTEHVYMNPSVKSIAYVTDHLVNEDEFYKISYPYTIETLLTNVVVKGNTKNKVNPTAEKKDLPYQVVSNKNIVINKSKGRYQIKASKNNELKIKLDEKIKNKIVLLNFTLANEWDCSLGDASIRVQNITNTLTCKGWMYKNKNKTFHYVLADKVLDEIQIYMNPGFYEIDTIETFVIDYETLLQNYKDDIGVRLNKNETKGDHIVADVFLENNGYFVTSIPYDVGFKIYDNDQLIPYEKVNTAFIGFPIKKGRHHIKMVYEAPYKKIASIMSLIGVILYIIMVVMQKYKKFDHKTL